MWARRSSPGERSLSWEHPGNQTFPKRSEGRRAVDLDVRGKEKLVDHRQTLFQWQKGEARPGGPSCSDILGVYESQFASSFSEELEIKGTAHDQARKIEPIRSAPFKKKTNREDRVARGDTLPKQVTPEKSTWR